MLRTSSNLWDIWIYFKHFYSGYLVYLVGIFNFLTLQYYLLIDKMNILRVLFPSFLSFALTFLILVFPLGVVFAYLDYRKGSVPKTHILLAKNNPFSKDLSKAIQYIAKGENDKAVSIMDKWT